MRPSRGLLCMVLVGSSATAYAEDVVMPDGTHWDLANRELTHDKLTIKEIATYRSNVTCAAGLNALVNPNPTYAPTGWAARERIGTQSAVNNVCVANNGLVTVATVIWLGTLDATMEGQLKSALALVQLASEQNGPTTSVELLGKSIAIDESTGVWTMYRPTDDGGVLRLVWPLQKNEDDLIGRAIFVTRATDAKSCAQTMQGPKPDWAPASYASTGKVDAENSLACIDTTDGRPVGIGVRPSQDPNDMPYIRAMAAAIGTGLGAVTSTPAVTTPTEPTPATPTTPETPSPPSGTYKPPSPLRYFTFWGNLFDAEAETVEQGYGAALGIRRTLLPGKLEPVIAGEIGYGTTSKLSYDVQLALALDLSVSFGIEAAVGYDAVGAGDEPAADTVVVNEGLYYGGRGVIYVDRIMLAAGYYFRTDDMSDHEIRVEASYGLESLRLYARFQQYADVANLFSVGLKFF